MYSVRPRLLRNNVWSSLLRMAALAANLVWLLHLCVVAWFVATPFVGDRRALQLHFILSIFLWLHWLANNDTCALTLLERALRGGVPSEATFMHSLVSPVYKVHADTVKLGIWNASILLWGVSAYRLSRGA